MLAPRHIIAEARALLADSERQLERLRSLQPYLIDLSLRENPVGSGIGQTLEDKLRIFPLLREFGLRNILLGSLDYSVPDEPEVDDDFMIYLRDRRLDMNGCFAFTDIGSVDAQGNFQPSPSQIKLKAYRIPNTLHEIYLSDAGMAGKYDFESLCRNLMASIRWLHANVSGDHGGAPRVIINIVDGCDAFAQDTERTCALLELLAGAPIEGISIEDDRGTYLPFQIGTYVAIARRCLPSPKKLLVHVHSGAGYENASVIEALLRGADGVWGGLPKQAAIIGHASLGELIANLARIGNPHMQEYSLERLLPLTTALQTLDSETSVPEDVPILGQNAYRLTLSFFRQQQNRFMDLAPERIGGKYEYRICPVVSDPPVIAGRLAEVTGRPASSFPQELLNQMIRLMRRDLRNGLRIRYDDPAQLMALLQRAGETSIGQAGSESGIPQSEQAFGSHSIPQADRFPLRPDMPCKPIDSSATHGAEDGVYRKLLESTKAIPWRIDWQTMQFSYIGPQIERLLGWSQSSWISVNDWAERIHPEDREKTVAFCVSQSKQGVDHEADYRAIASDGELVWIRDVVHVVRRPDGSVDSLVGFMFDISERKKAEDRILQLQKELQTLSYQDGLTGLANRRMFDTLFDIEWAKARASRHPLSLVLLDVDFFKQYNDHYGHLQGDACLQRIAKVIQESAARTRDFCARFGGEEFVLILPETNDGAALQIAERCRRLLLLENIPHARSPVAGSVTFSMGVGTIVPGAHDDPTDFIALVDRRLYQAKADGRNRIDCAAR